MTDETFEFAIKRDVRNNPIVREVDRDRHREMWRTLAIGLLLVVVLLFSAWQHFELLRHGYRVEQLQKDLAVEAELKRRLRHEIEKRKSPARIERLATTQLHMVVPGPSDTTVVERVVPADAPPRSVVARR
jgi:cell division protein FtsL